MRTHSTDAVALVTLGFLIATPSMAQPVSGVFYAIDCVPASGPCDLVRIDFSGSAEWVGRLGDVNCDRFGGGTIAFTASAIEGLAFDSDGRLWGAGDNAAQAVVEYQFHIDASDGHVISCKEMVLGTGLNVDDAGGLAPWSVPGRLVGTDRIGQDILFLFDPQNHSQLDRGDDPSDGRGRGLARFPSQGNEYYSSEDGNQLYRVTCSGGCTGDSISTSRVLVGNLTGVGGQHQNVNSLTAVPGGKLYGYDDDRDSLLEIDPADGSVDSEVFISGYTPSSINGLAFLNVSSGRVDSLTVARGGNGDLTLSWLPSCDANDRDYGVYAGNLDGTYNHAFLTCSTGRLTTWTFSPQAGNRYYLVVPRNESIEGSYGRSSDSMERPQGSPACKMQGLNSC